MVPIVKSRKPPLLSVNAPGTNFRVKHQVPGPRSWQASFPLLPWEIIGAAANTGDVEHGEAFAHGYETWKLWPELLSNFPCVSTRSTSASETLAQTDELKQSSEKPCCIWNSVGEDGLAAAAAHKPDLILMDIQLPGLDGYEATRRLKADPALRSIPIIVVTSYALSGDDAKARAAGCDAYVTKPFSPRQLLAKIKEYLP